MCIDQNKLIQIFKAKNKIGNGLVDLGGCEYYSWLNSEDSLSEIHLFPTGEINRSEDDQNYQVINEGNNVFLGNHHWSIYLKDKSLTKNIVKGHAKWATSKHSFKYRKFSIELKKKNNNAWFVEEITWDNVDDNNSPTKPLKYERVARFLAEDSALDSLKTLFIEVLN